jgi:hypothetical protein
MMGQLSISSLLVVLLKQYDEIKTGVMYDMTDQ